MHINWQPLLIVLCFITADFLMGLIVSVKTATFKSSRMREGLWHKLGEVLALCFAWGVDYALPLAGLELPVPLLAGVCTYIIIMELGSIVEHLAALSPALGEVLHRHLLDNNLTQEEHENDNTRKGREAGHRNS